MTFFLFPNIIMSTYGGSVNPKNDKKYLLMRFGYLSETTCGHRKSRGFPRPLSRAVRFYVKSESGRNVYPISSHFVSSSSKISPFVFEVLCSSTIAPG